MNIYRIKPVDAINGPGLRMSIWIAGCCNNCPGCWAKETWDPFLGRDWREIFPEIIEGLKKPTDGVSLLGGDPFYTAMEDDPEQFLEFLKRLREVLGEDRSIWCWTGYLFEDILQKCPETLKYIDVLVDGKYDKSLRNITLHFRGSSNQRIIDVRSSMETGEVVELNFEE